MFYSTCYQTLCIRKSRDDHSLIIINWVSSPETILFYIYSYCNFFQLIISSLGSYFDLFFIQQWLLLFIYYLRHLANLSYNVLRVFWFFFLFIFHHLFITNSEAICLRFFRCVKNIVCEIRSSNFVSMLLVKISTLWATIKVNCAL